MHHTHPSISSPLGHGCAQREFQIPLIFFHKDTLCFHVCFQVIENVSDYFYLQRKLTNFDNTVLTLEDREEEEEYFKTFSLEEVSKHDSPETGIWITYNGNVYDITDYVNSHPGGPDKIMMAGGGAVDTFWSFYPVHKNSPVLNVLEKYRIGGLAEEDREAHVDHDEDPFKDDPTRDPSLVPCSMKPFIAEASVDLLMDHYITPSELHYVRNHMPVPIINEEDYQLSLSGKGVRDVKLSFEELKTKFKKHTFAATLHCAGNRAVVMSEAKKIVGLSSGAGDISTSEWGGALLKDVLEYAGLEDQAIESLGVQHVQFEGLDFDITDTSYGASIPVYKAMDSRGDVLLAYEMNGKELPLDHGFPVRIIAPGIAGCRSVKWLGKIIVSESESDSFWQQKTYKGCPPNIDTKSLDFTPFPAIQEYPVTSAICYPRDNQTFTRKDDAITVKGYAWSGGGRAIIRVDLSIDGGKTWTVATLKRREQPPGRQWAWTFWECDVTLPVDLDRLEIVSKAVDSSYNVQPENSLPIWNPRGYLSHAWSRVNILLEN
jgi:sulfite oxidase